MAEMKAREDKNVVENAEKKKWRKLKLYCKSLKLDFDYIYI